MYPDYRRTAEQRQARAINWLLIGGAILGVAFWGFLAYAVLHFVQKFW